MKHRARIIASENWSWEPPPTTGRGRGVRVIDELEPLRARPGMWARIRGPYDDFNTAGSFVANLHNGGFAEIEPGEYEAESHRNETDDQIYVWARYVGSDEQNETIAEGQSFPQRRRIVGRRDNP